MADPIMLAVERLRRILDHSGLTPSKAATLASVDRSKVYDWINDKGRPQKLADVELVIEAAEIYEKSPSNKRRKLRRGQVRLIKVLPGLKAGVPDQSFSDVDEIEVLDWGSDYERWGRTVDGDSMLPLLNSGDLVIFENRQAEPNHVVHAEFEGHDDTVKVYRKVDGIGMLLPTNPHFEPMKMNGKWVIKGVAVQLIRKLPHDESVTYDFKRGMRFRESLPTAIGD